MALGTVRMRSTPGSTVLGRSCSRPGILRGQSRARPPGRDPVCYARPMPRFRPFAGLRYDPSVPLDKVIAPPYDVVGPEERAELAARHRANAIHVELPVRHPHGLDRYRSAAQHLRHAGAGRGPRARGPSAAFYAYRMTAPERCDDDRRHRRVARASRRGGDILPHEQTIPKDKSDRLDLLRACRANLSPIWGLSLARGLSGPYEPDGPPQAEAVDDDGVRPRAVGARRRRRSSRRSCAPVGSAPVVIADGHHRYETALDLPGRAARPGSDGARAPTTWSWRWWSSWPMTSCRSVRSTGPRGPPAGLDLAERSGGGSTSCTPVPVDDQRGRRRRRGPGLWRSSPGASLAADAPQET